MTWVQGRPDDCGFIRSEVGSRRGNTGQVGGAWSRSNCSAEPIKLKPGQGQRREVESGGGEAGARGWQTGGDIALKDVLRGTLPVLIIYKCIS